MAELTIYQDSYIGATIVSNRFIDEYMLDANAAQLKIYLYLLRMLNAHLKTGITDICERFNYMESDVMRSLRYWEKAGLLTLEYGEDQQLTGIHMKNLCSLPQSQPSAEETHAPEVIPESIAPKKASSGKTAGTAAGAAEAPVKDAAVSSAAPRIPAKASYSRDQIQAFRNSESGGQILFLAETYLSKILTAGDIDSLYFIGDVLGFSTDLTDYLLQYCAERGKRSFRYIEKVAIGWATEGITTVEQARAHVNTYDKTVASIMNGLGRSGVPTQPELEYITRWTGEYAFSLDIILEACKRTVIATDSNRIKYADRILSAWHKDQVKTLADVERQDKEHRAAAGSPKQDTGRGGRSQFHIYQESGIDYDDLAAKRVKN
ncbi:MAG: DnaD domain protein [Lachnospiraceae bacterium]|nr:DnaD domain protein [Lachnospiraceae bacterium]